MPILILVLAQGNVNLLGDLYAFGLIDPYLEDKPAQAAFSQAESLGRRPGAPSRIVYVPAKAGPRGVWSAVQPGETILAPEQAEVLSGLPIDYGRREDPAGNDVRHYFRRWPAA